MKKLKTGVITHFKKKGNIYRVEVESPYFKETKTKK